ncbi:MAG: alpha/beta hydrolase, partial [Chloroflexia bacterium]
PMTKPALLLLHGALGAKIQFEPLTSLLAEHFTVHSVNFEGHGDAPALDRPFRMEHFIENVLDYLATNNIQTARVFGYSMGGYVASLLASTFPDKVHSIATLGTKFYWDPETAARETAFLDPDKIKAKVPQFAATLNARHIAYGWENVLRATADLLNTLGETGGLRAPTLSQIQCPVRVIVGDRDRTIPVPEAHEVYRALPQGQLQVLPATPHEFERIDSGQLAQILLSFFITQ